ncbi:MAG TPA: PAAR domain-containing protein [Xanthobacteraceae bacterium]|nr:PAAR domain-containing protein [Xanthobacteraceae bacterium]
MPEGDHHANNGPVACHLHHFVLRARCRRRPPTGVVTQGSPDTIIGGKSAARVGDNTTSSAPLVEGSPNVFINGRPAAIGGGRNGCGGVVVGGSSSVFINGKPAAQVGSQTTECTGR